MTPPGLYARRVEQEWRLLTQLAAANPDTLEVLGRRQEPDGDVFVVALRHTTGLVRDGGGLRLADDHEVHVHFRRPFPSVPLEASVSRPVFHPNVHPENGFACLWGKLSANETVVEAFLRLQGVLTWRYWNEEALHLMQPDALEWYRTSSSPWSLPLEARRLVEPAELALERTARSRPDRYRRRRLEPLG